MKVVDNKRESLHTRSAAGYVVGLSLTLSLPCHLSLSLSLSQSYYISLNISLFVSKARTHAQSSSLFLSFLPSLFESGTSYLFSLHAHSIPPKRVSCSCLVLRRPSLPPDRFAFHVWTKERECRSAKKNKFFIVKAKRKVYLELSIAPFKGKEQQKPLGAKIVSV